MALRREYSRASTKAKNFFYISNQGWPKKEA